MVGLIVEGTLNHVLCNSNCINKFELLRFHVSVGFHLPFHPTDNDPPKKVVGLPK